MYENRHAEKGQCIEHKGPDGRFQADNRADHHRCTEQPDIAGAHRPQNKQQACSQRVENETGDIASNLKRPLAAEQDRHDHDIGAGIDGDDTPQPLLEGEKKRRNQGQWPERTGDKTHDEQNALAPERQWIALPNVFRQEPFFEATPEQQKFFG